MQLWSFARVNLRLNEEEFWSLTLAQLNVLAERYMERQQIEDARVGRICAVIANVNRDPKKHPRAYQPRDFMPRKRERLTPDQWRERLVAINAAFGGEVHG